MWHASVSFRRHNWVLVPTAEWTLRTMRRAEEIAERALRGVGAGASRWDTKKVALHFRRSLSDEEIAGLDPAWCAIPAVDMG